MDEMARFIVGACLGTLGVLIVLWDARDRRKDRKIDLPLPPRSSQHEWELDLELPDRSHVSHTRGRAIDPPPDGRF